MLLDGLFAAATTPFYPDGRVYFRKLQHNVDRYSRTMLAGIAVLGSTGEAVMLNDADTRDVLGSAIEAAAPDKVMLAGVARESVRDTVALAEHAARLSYDAILVRTPSFYGSQLTAEAMLAYYRSVADHSPLPVILYSVPRFTHYELPIEVIAQLAQHPNILGLKDSGGSIDRIRALIAATANSYRRTVEVTAVFEAVTARMHAAQPAGAPMVSGNLLQSGGGLSVAAPSSALKTRTREVGFQLLCGSINIFQESLVAGAPGAVLAFAACAPQAAQEIYLAWKDRDPQLALDRQKRLAHAADTVVLKYGIAGVKFACDLNGYYGGAPRLPLLPLTAESKREIEDCMQVARN